MKHVFIVLAVFIVADAVFADDRQCNRMINIGQSKIGNLTIPLQYSGLTCLNVSPPEDENRFVLLGLPASLSVTLNGKTYESNDASHRHCFLMTPNKRCPLWQEKIRDDCPGGAIAKPIFGKTTVYIKTVSGSSHDGSNETIVGYELIHRRFSGFIHGECTDLEPPTVAPTTNDPTTIATEPTQTTKVNTDEPTPKSMLEPLEPTTQIPSGTNGEDKPISDGLLVAIIVIIAVLIIVICAVCGVRANPRKNDRIRKLCCISQDPEKPAAGPNNLESRRRLVSANSSAASASPGGSRDTVSFQRETGEE